MEHLRKYMTPETPIRRMYLFHAPTKRGKMFYKENGYWTSEPSIEIRLKYSSRA